MKMRVTDDERAILAPAVRRACALLLHWSGSGSENRDMAGINRIFSELATVDEATDCIIVLLLLQNNHDTQLPSASTLKDLALGAAMRESL
jgi:hypothetical protein